MKPFFINNSYHTVHMYFNCFKELVFDIERISAFNQNILEIFVRAVTSMTKISAFPFMHFTLQHPSVTNSDFCDRFWCIFIADFIEFCFHPFNNGAFHSHQPMGRAFGNDSGHVDVLNAMLK